MRKKKLFAGACLALLLLHSLSGMAEKLTKSHYSVKLQGSCIYANSWEDATGATPTGIYLMSQKDGFAVVPFMTEKLIYSNGGGAFVGDDFYCVWKQEDKTSETTICQLLQLNLKTGERKNHGICDANLVTTSAGTAVDPTTGLVYGIFWDSQYKNTRELGVVDYPNMSRTTIATIDQVLYGLCIDTKGQMYAINSDGNLVKVDKSNGDISTVGPTGIKPKYMQAAAVDAYTNKMYWNAISKEGTWICEVDLATGSTTKLAQLDDKNEFSTMRVLPPEAEDKAPAPVSGLEADFIDGATTGTVSFTMPTESFDGTPLQGELSYQISNADEILAEGSASAGEEVDKQVTVADGEQVITVTASNKVGRSPAENVKRYVGYDTPEAPTDVVLAIDDNTAKASLSWKAPVKGIHGGYIDTEGLTYNITRLPDNEKAAGGLSSTQWTETLEKGSAKAYKYSVTACNHNRESEAAVSNPIVYGNGLETPWSCTFDDKSSLDLFTIVDANNDGNTWVWTRHHNQAAHYSYSETNDADDWLITPPLALKADHDYTISFEEEVLSNKYPEKMELCYGEGLNTDSYTVVMPVTTFLNDKYKTNTFNIRPQSDGDYRLAFHIVSDAFEGTMSIDNLSVEPNPSAGVKGIEAKGEMGDSRVYDLSGRLVVSKGLNPGIYIRNGKKMVVSK